MATPHAARGSEGVRVLAAAKACRGAGEGNEERRLAGLHRQDVADGEARGTVLPHRDLPFGLRVILRMHVQRDTVSSRRFYHDAIGLQGR